MTAGKSESTPSSSRIVDPGRLAAVAATGLLDTPAEDVFDKLAELATRLTGLPLAFVTLVDAQRSYWKATVGTGIDANDIKSRQNAVHESFCQYVIEGDGPVVISDAAENPMTANNPSVSSMGVRAWAGFPVRGPEGHVLGSFCVVDTSPHSFSDQDQHVLAALAESASRELALRALVRSSRELAKAAEKANHRLRRQARASSVLGESLDPLAVLQTLADLVVPEAGNWVAVAVPAMTAHGVFGNYESADSADVVIVNVRHQNPVQELHLRRVLRDIPLSSRDSHGVGRVLTTGQAEYLREFDLDGLRLARAPQRPAGA